MVVIVFHVFLATVFTMIAFWIGQAIFGLFAPPRTAATIVLLIIVLAALLNPDKDLSIIERITAMVIALSLASRYRILS
jgi:hypothetical protein